MSVGCSASTEKKQKIDEQNKTNLHRFNRFLNAIVYVVMLSTNGPNEVASKRASERTNEKIKSNAANIGNYPHSILHIIVKTSIKYQLPNKKRNK